jgi:glycosyltransferase involved in cell wall biosynthesis
MFEPECADSGGNISRVETCREGGIGGCADIAYIGRFEPEKRIQAIVGIVEEARKRSGVNLRLLLAGKCPDTDNGREIKALAAKYDWVRLEGTLYGAAKVAFLASCKFALHGCKVEAFGISITEYLKAGLVPVVPREGGSSEVVGLDDLVYGSDDEATEILARLATEEVFYRKCQAHCKERGKEFLAAAYMNRQKELMDEVGISAV